MITVEILHAAFPTTPSAVLGEYVAPLNAFLPRYGITTKQRIAAFLAQVGHESAGFSTRIENLNYGAPGLRSIFGKYFPNDALANAYARQPEKIANRVYASRMGNGNEASGDGWRYRGKGLIQCTGKQNHAAFATAVEMSLADATAYMLTAEGAVASACWFWNSRSLNNYCDGANGADMGTLTKKINGGDNGLADRLAHYRKLISLL